jgi:hypothetical protein
MPLRADKNSLGNFYVAGFLDETRLVAAHLGPANARIAAVPLVRKRH